jgi:drug/metabolite transporter (DMT)-like permease
VSPDAPSSLPSSSRALRIAAFGALYVIWGSTYLAIRIAIEDIPPFAMAAIRFLIAGSLLYGWVRARGVARPTRVQWRNALLVGCLLLTVGNGFVVRSELTVPSGLAAVLIAMMPAWMALFEWLLDRRKKPGAQVVCGIALGLVGVVALVGPGLRSAGAPIDPVGAALIVMAEIAWVLGSLYARRADLPKSAPLATAMEMLWGGALLAVVSLALGEWRGFDPRAVSWSAWLALAYLIVFGSLIALSAYVWLLSVTTTARVSTYAYVNPVIAVFLGWMFADERLTPRTWIAAAAIITAVVVITTYRSRASAPSSTSGPSKNALASSPIKR